MSSFIYPDSFTRKMFGQAGKVQAKRKAFHQRMMEAKALLEKQKAVVQPTPVKISWWIRFINWIKSIVSKR